MTRSRTPRFALARRIAASDDSGVSLIFALIFITVVAMVIGVVLSYIATAAHGNITERSVAARESAAEGAAQIEINAIRRNTDYTSGTGQDCFDNGDTDTLNDFYDANSVSYTATITCVPDPDHSSGGGGTGGKGTGGGGGPVNAILTLGKSDQENGLYLQANGSKNSFVVDGGVFSNSNIATNRLFSNSSVTARGDCTGTITASPENCKIGNKTNAAGDDPNYDPPVPDRNTPHPPVPGCDSKDKKIDLIKLSPGIYDNDALGGLNNLTDGNCNDTFWFQPGTYYFSFDGKWTLNTGYVVGGTLAQGQVVDGQAPAMPGACQAPYGGGQQQPGVEFVFGGTSRLVLSHGSIELCGNPEQDGPPIAIYGLKSDVGRNSYLVPAETDCITQPNGCSVISSDNSPNSQMYIDGLTYMPDAAIDLKLNNETGQVFGYSVIARHLAITATGSADLSNALISGPPGSGGPRVTVVDLTVCVRQSGDDQQGACLASLHTRVGFTDTGGGTPTVTIYSWLPTDG